ncbi:MAG: LPS export ABC transporter periplasmic protein LptC [Spirochaetota bacterium]|nr:LPS export ABC transporter periplasmic protein LptC [Spirochaetota bacterium]
MKTIAIINIIMLLVLSCDDDQKETVRKDVVIPTSESKLIKMYSYSKTGKIQTVISGQYDAIYRRSNEIWLDTVRLLHVAKSKGKTVFVELTADKGKVNYKTMNCEAWSNAVIIREKEVRVETHRIYWNDEQKKFYTKDEGQVTVFKLLRPNDPKDDSVIKVVGKNMVADNGLETIELDEAITATPKSASKEGY